MLREYLKSIKNIYFTKSDLETIYSLYSNCNYNEALPSVSKLVKLAVEKNKKALEELELSTYNKENIKWYVKQEEISPPRHLLVRLNDIRIIRKKFQIIKDSKNFIFDGNDYGFIGDLNEKKYFVSPFELIDNKVKEYSFYEQNALISTYEKEDITIKKNIFIHKLPSEDIIVPIAELNKTTKDKAFINLERQYLNEDENYKEIISRVKNNLQNLSLQETRKKIEDEISKYKEPETIQEHLKDSGTISFVKVKKQNGYSNPVILGYILFALSSLILFMLYYFTN